MKDRNRIYIGIDPGKSGAIAVILPDDIIINDMPLFAKREVNSKAIHMFFVYLLTLTLKQPIVCCLEQAQSMPGQGVKGVFNYGKDYGRILSCLEINDISYQEIHSLTWKKVFGLVSSKKNKKIKKDSVAKAIKLFPDQRDKFMTPRGRLLDGRAEALLMAEYARRYF